jgi:hypothetical protein
MVRGLARRRSRYAAVGVWGAVILTIIRMIQGIGVGGEWGGSVLFAMEWARTNKHRCLITSWPQFGGPAGLFLANMAVLVGSANEDLREGMAEDASKVPGPVIAGTELLLQRFPRDEGGALRLDPIRPLR